jgi:hypothetical protein
VPEDLWSSTQGTKCQRVEGFSTPVKSHGEGY